MVQRLHDSDYAISERYCQSTVGIPPFPLLATTDFYAPARVVKRRTHPSRKAVGSFAAVGFGAYIALTGLVGITFGA
jgi:hypothetical protein